MSLCDIIFAGSKAALGLAEKTVNDAIGAKGSEQKVAFPDTAYALPVIYAATGTKITTLGELKAALDVAKSLIVEEEDLAKALNAGLATAVSAEIIEAVKYAVEENPYENENGIGFVPDPVIRSLGVPLVTGDIPGIAVILGEAEDRDSLADIVRDYQQKGLLTFLIGNVIEQAMDAGVKQTWISSDSGWARCDFVIHVVSVAVRAALIFGALSPGDLEGFGLYKGEGTGICKYFRSLG